MNINRGINHIGLTVPDIEAATAFSKKGSTERLLMIVNERRMNLVVGK